MKRTLLTIVPLLLALGAFWGTYWVLNSPNYALYHVASSLRDGDAATFLAYVDLPRLMAAQVGSAMGGHTTKDNAVNEDNLAQALGSVLNTMVADNPNAVQRQFRQIVGQLDAEQLPSPWLVAFAANVRRSGDRALVVFSDPERGDRLRMGMVRTDGTWRLVHVDQRDVARLLAKYGSREGGVGGVMRPAPPATPAATVTP